MRVMVRVGLTSVEIRDILIVMDIPVSGVRVCDLNCHKAGGIRDNYEIITI